MTIRKSSMNLDEEVREAKEAYLEAGRAWENAGSVPSGPLYKAYMAAVDRMGKAQAKRATAKAMEEERQ